MKLIFKSDEDLFYLHYFDNTEVMDKILEFLRKRYVGKPAVFLPEDALERIKVTITDIQWSRVPYPALYVFAEHDNGYEKVVVDGYLDHFLNMNGRAMKMEVEL